MEWMVFHETKISSNTSRKVLSFECFFLTSFNALTVYKAIIKENHR